MRFSEDIACRSNLEIIVRERGKRVLRECRKVHNIYTNIGRQFICEVITASSFPTSTSFVRTQNDVVRWIGFGIGGNRQSSSSASSPPFSTDYAGTNVQTDSDLTVSGLERPIAVTGIAGIPPTGTYVKQVLAPGTFPSATFVEYIALFTETDLNFGPFTSVPLSEIGLFKGAADPTLPNGTVGAYPGPGGHILAYDNFNTVQKSGLFSIEVHWQLRLT